MEDASPKLIDIGIKSIKFAWKKLNPSKPHKKYNLLCVELGHLRYKTALIGIYSDTYDVELAKKSAKSNENFFGQSGFENFAEYLKNLKKQLEADKSVSEIDGLVLSLCCPVNSKDGRIDDESEYFEGWESKIRLKLHEELLEDDIVILNDAVAFALGCQDDTIMRGLKLPVLCLTLGGGIGSAFIQQGKSKKGAILQKNRYFVEPFEVGHIWKEWSDGFEGNPHQLAGQDFFDWADTKQHWNEVQKKQQFSQRIAWIINAIANEEKRDFRSVIIGGGRSREYVDQSIVSENISLKNIELKVEPDTYLSLQGSAKLWLQEYHYKKSITDLIGSNI